MEKIIDCFFSAIIKSLSGFSFASGLTFMNVANDIWCGKSTLSRRMCQLGYWYWSGFVYEGTWTLTEKYYAWYIYLDVLNHLYIIGYFRNTVDIWTNCNQFECLFAISCYSFRFGTPYLVYKLTVFLNRPSAGSYSGNQWYSKCGIYLFFNLNNLM